MLFPRPSSLPFAKPSALHGRATPGQTQEQQAMIQLDNTFRPPRRSYSPIYPTFTASWPYSPAFEPGKMKLKPTAVGGLHRLAVFP